MHRRFQYSVRTLLLVMLAIGLGTIWWVNRANRQKNAVACILKAGGGVVYGYQYDAAGKLDTNAEPSGPAWLRDSLGIDYFSRVTDVYLTGESFGDTELKSLKSLPDLRTLLVAGPRVTDAGLVHLKQLHRLEELQLCGAGITDAGLTHLQFLHELRTLTLACSITDGGMKHLLPLANLRTLKSCGTSGNCDRIIDALASPTSIDYVQVPLPDVCEHLAVQHAIKLHIDDAGLDEARIDREVAVTYSSKTGIALGTALDGMLEPLGLDWVVSPNALVITARSIVARKRSGLAELKAALPRLTDVYVDW